MLSVIIIAKNESLTIENCLKSVYFADEIIVLDSGSTDNTVEIAKRYTDKVYETDWPGYGAQKQRALTLSTQPWVLNLDADESVDGKLREDILKKLKTGTADAYRIPIRMQFYGQTLRFSSSPSRHIRLFKREGARYCDAIVHEKVLLPRHFQIEQIRNPIWHHSFQDVSHMLQKLDRYSSYSAKIRLSKQRSSSLTAASCGALWMFFRCYLLQLGCLDGKAGFLFAVFNAQSSFYRSIKQCYPDQNLAHLPEVQLHE